MQAFVSSLTAALLFIHAIFGCCWHHAHHCEHSSTVAHAAPCCGHHQHDGDSKDEKPCSGRCEVTCTYVIPAKVEIEAPQGWAFGFLAVLPSLADCHVELAASCEAGCPPPELVPPLRAHLLHQVLLN